MCQTYLPWVSYMTDVILILAALLSVYVMRQAEKDRSINRVDSKAFRTARSISFVAVAACALIAVMTDISQVSLLALFTSAAALLVVSAVTLHYRPPSSGTRKSVIGASAISDRASPLRETFSIFKRNRGG